MYFKIFPSKKDSKKAHRNTKKTIQYIKLVSKKWILKRRVGI